MFGRVLRLRFMFLGFVVLLVCSTLLQQCSMLFQFRLEKTDFRHVLCETVQNKQQQRDSDTLWNREKPPGWCRYEHGHGSFHPQSTWTWKTNNSEECPVIDYAYLFAQPTIDPLKAYIRTPITLLQIGDSLDVRILNAISISSGFLQTIVVHIDGTTQTPNSTSTASTVAAPAEDDDDNNNPQAVSPTLTSSSSSIILDLKNNNNTTSATANLLYPPNRSRNQAKNAEHFPPIVSDQTKSITMACFKIFGMHHTCTNGRIAAKSDSRQDLNQTADRVRYLLPVDILTHLPTTTSTTTTLVLLSSSLWDLSHGCNDQRGIAEDYQLQYREGILALYSVVKELLPNAIIAWRTSPPLSKSYNRKTKQNKRGRTRSNQMALNELLKQTVSEHQLGIVMDWWTQVSTVPEDVLEQQIPDGRHYKALPNRAFFNMWLNAMVDWYPQLRVEGLEHGDVPTMTRIATKLEETSRIL